MKTPSVLSVSRMELLSFAGIAWTLVITLFYIVFTLFILNYRLALTTLTQPFPLGDKLAIFTSLFEGLFTAFSPFDTTLVIMSAILVGINIFLVGKTLYRIEHNGKLKLSLGGATLISLISAGCSSCGFSILSILGLSASLSFLPFHGIGLHIVSVAFLLFSSWYMLKKLRDSLYCKRI